MSKQHRKNWILRVLCYAFLAAVFVVNCLDRISSFAQVSHLLYNFNVTSSLDNLEFLINGLFEAFQTNEKYLKIILILETAYFVSMLISFRIKNIFKDKVAVFSLLGLLLSVSLLVAGVWVEVLTQFSFYLEVLAIVCLAFVLEDKMVEYDCLVFKTIKEEPTFANEVKKVKRKTPKPLSKKAKIIIEIIRFSLVIYIAKLIFDIENNWAILPTVLTLIMLTLFAFSVYKFSCGSVNKKLNFASCVSFVLGLALCIVVYFIRNFAVEWVLVLLGIISVIATTFSSVVFAFSYQYGENKRLWLRIPIFIVVLLSTVYYLLLLFFAQEAMREMIGFDTSIYFFVALIGNIFFFHLQEKNVRKIAE